MDNSNQIIMKAKFFEFYSQKIWPFHRLFVKHKLSHRCRLCVVSEKLSKLTYGICEACRSWENVPRSIENPVQSSDIQEMNQILHSYVGKGPGNYDATVLLSGGKDSALLLSELAKNHPRLRLLGVSIDNGYMSPVAKSNVSFLVQKLSLDHLFVRPSMDFCRKTFRHALLHSRTRGGYDVVDRMAGDLLHDLGRNIAAQYRTPLLLTGMSRQQVQKIFGVHHWEMPSERESRARTESAGFKLRDVYTEKEMQHWWDPKRFPQQQVHRLLFPLYAWNRNEQEIRKEVMALGLVPPGKDSPLVTNDALIPVVGVVDIVNLGYSSFEHEFAQMVREGKTDRDYWIKIYELLEYCGKTGWLLKKDVIGILQDLNIKPDELGIYW